MSTNTESNFGIVESLTKWKMSLYDADIYSSFFFEGLFFFFGLFPFKRENNDV